MKRVFSDSKVSGYQLFRYASGTAVHPIFYVRYNGREIRTNTVKLSEAQREVKRLAGDDARGIRLTRMDTTVGKLLDLLVADYRTGQIKSSAIFISQIERHLRPYFGASTAARVVGDLSKWMVWRRALLPKREVKPRTINADIALLRRAFILGLKHDPPLVARVPAFRMLKVNNTRKGFVDKAQYNRLMAELPDFLKPITCVAFHAGNRKGELLRLEWSDVDLAGDPPTFTLWPGETKSGRGRTLPILPGPMTDMFADLAKRRTPTGAHVFSGPDGSALKETSMRLPWKAACKRAGMPDLLFHDLRRSAVRNLRRAGVSESVAMKISGHQSNTIFKRYDIVDFEDLRDASKRLSRFLDAQPEK